MNVDRVEAAYKRLAVKLKAQSAMPEEDMKRLHALGAVIEFLGTGFPELTIGNDMDALSRLRAEMLEAQADIYNYPSGKRGDKVASDVRCFLLACVRAGVALGMTKTGAREHVAACTRGTGYMTSASQLKNYEMKWLPEQRTPQDLGDYGSVSTLTKVERLTQDLIEVHQGPMQVKSYLKLQIKAQIRRLSPAK